MLTDLPNSGENIHEQADIDEASLKTNIGNISHPDLILNQGFQAGAPWTYPLKRFCCLTRTLDGDQEIIIFHQPSEYGVSLTQVAV